MSLPKLLPRPTGGQPPEPEPPQASKRRKGAHHTACNPCRGKREKCSGERPECKTCWRLNRHCEYAAPLGVTRQQANKQRLAVVERTSLNLQYLVRLLRESSEADALLALRRIRQAPDLEEAISVLAAAQALLSPASTAGPLPEHASRPDEASSADSNLQSAERSRSSSTETSGYTLEKGPAQTRDQYIQNHVPIDLSVPDLPFSRWTSACTDDRFMNHLMTLFWTWDNTVEPMLFRPLFEDDLCNNSAAFCSPFLVNALLALSCLFTSEDAAFSEPGDYMTRGRQFAEEAEQHLARERNSPSIPLLQGQFAMFVFEGNVHGGSKSMAYFKRTVETYEALTNNGSFERQSFGKTDARGRKEEEGLSWVTWGVYCAAWRVSQTFGVRSPVTRPLIPKLWQHSTFSLRHSDSAPYWWSAYPESRHVQESMKVEIREALSNLSEIAEKALGYLYPESDGVSRLPAADPGRAVELYHTLTHWKLLLPSRLRMEDAILPSAILLHSYVEMLLGDILRPFSQFTKMQFGPFEPKERCYSHCVSLMNTIWTFRAFTSLNSEYCYIPILATVAFMALQEHSVSLILTETLIKACRCLYELSSEYRLATDALSAIQGAFKKLNMPVPMCIRDYLACRSRHTQDGLLHGAIARLMLTIGAANVSGSLVRFQDFLDDLDEDA